MIRITWVFLLALFISTALFLQINSVQGAANIINNATVRLSEIDKNLTATMINMSLTQINDSLASDTTEETTFNLEMAKNTVNDLIFGLSNKSDHIRVDFGNVDLCSEHPIDCMIGRLYLVLDSLDRGDLQIAKDVLKSILGSVA